jgi:hypothetical protein
LRSIDWNDTDDGTIYRYYAFDQAERDQLTKKNDQSAASVVLLVAAAAPSQTEDSTAMSCCSVLLQFNNKSGINIKEIEPPAEFTSKLIDMFCCNKLSSIPFDKNAIRPLYSCISDKVGIIIIYHFQN